MPARGGQLERAPGTFLPAHVRKVGCHCRAVPVRHERRLGLQLELATEEGRGLGEMPDRDRGDPRESGLAGGVGRAQETLGTEPPSTLCDGEDAADPAETAVERELADRGGALERAARELLRRCEERERDREVEAGSLLAQLGGRKIDRDPAGREAQLCRGDSRAHPLTRLLAGAIGEADDGEARDAVASVRLHVDPTRLEADERMRDRACKHASRL